MPMASTSVAASTGNAAPRSPYGAATRMAGRVGRVSSVARARYASITEASSCSAGTATESETSAGSSSWTQVAPAAARSVSSSA